MLTARNLLKLTFTSLAVAACAPAPVPPAAPAPAGASATPNPAPAAPPALLHGGVAPKVDASLTPREVFFGNPQRTSVQLSPDAKHVAYLAPKDGVLNVWVAPLDDPKNAKPVTNDQKRGIRRYAWAFTNQHILYLQDSGGDENWHVHSVAVATGEDRDLTPIDGVAARLTGVSHRSPKSIVVSLNDRDKRLHDLHRVDLMTGERKLVEKNEQGFAGYVLDDDYRVRLAVAFTKTGGLELKAPDAKRKEMSTVVAVGPEDALTTEPMGLSRDGRRVYLQDSRGRDKAALVELDLATRKAKTLFESEKADVSGLLMHPRDNTVLAVATSYERQTWSALDATTRGDLEALRGFTKGDPEVVSQSLDNQHWIVADVRDDGPVAYYHFARKNKAHRFLFVNNEKLQGLSLARMHPRIIRSRDGLELVSYLSLPPDTDPDGDGKPARPLPMVLDVHGGPWGRDSWGYNPYHQWLASRGYAVLSVNFRGSTGFGKKFVNLADREWAGKMHDDLLDGVAWAVEQSIALPDKVAIFGGSYGGYSVLVGLTFTPKQFACGVDIVGPSNLVTLLENIPPYWAPIAPMLKQRVGDPATEKDFLLARSPLSHVARIERPLLIAQGANDPRVKQQESDQIVQAMKSKNIPVVYALFPDEGHGFARPENRLAFTAVSEIFLAQCLGGSHQPIGTDFGGSSLTVPEGKAHLWGLSEALPKQ